jgi:archaellum component FlaC
MDKDNLEILLEDIRGKFDLVLEGHSSLHKRIDKAEENLNDKISLVDFKVGVLNQKIDGVHDKLDQKIDSVYDKLDQKIESVYDKLDQKIDGVYDKLDQKIDGVCDKLDQKIDGARDELGQKIDAVAVDLAAHRRDTEAHPSLYKVKEGN